MQLVFGRMKTSLIVSVVGPDRPGLVEALSRAVTAAGGNWEGSRLVQLGGQFAGVVQVVVTSESVGSLEESLAALEADGLHVSVVHSETVGDAARSGEVHSLEIVGQDRSGIVAEISRELAAKGVNVIELATDCREAPWSGERLFHTTATVSLPAGTGIDEVRAMIEAVAGDLMVETLRNDE